jgi:SAM-dependent methyltransferase
METVEFDRLPLGPGTRVLDIGCGEGRHAVAAARDAGEVVGVDLDPDRLLTAREDYDTYADGTPGTFLRGDALNLPFVDDGFDTVVCSEVLEHLPDHEAAIAELRRVCRPGGALAVSVPRYGPERVCWLLSEAYHQVEGGHVRIFNREELRAAVEAQGFRHLGGHFAHALHAPYWWLKCLWLGRADDADEHPLPVRAYERFLEWDILNEPRPVRAVEGALDPILGKSVVLYFEARR